MKGEEGARGPEEGDGVALVQNAREVLDRRRTIA
jgi:hypothetical protein